MRSTRLALVTALAATSLLTAAPAHARHVCDLDDLDERVDTACEAHVEETKLFQKLVCLILPSC